MELSTIHAVINSIATVIIGIGVAVVNRKKEGIGCKDAYQLSERVAILEERSKQEEKSFDRLEKAVDKLEEMIK